MNADEFEQSLEHQPIRQVPADWRGQILSAAREASGSAKHYSAASVPTTFSIWRAHLASLLWPSPKAWTALAAVWLLLAGANRITLSFTPGLADAGTRLAPATIAAWKEQERILDELIQPAGIPKAEAIAPAKPRPHSELTGPPRMS